MRGLRMKWLTPGAMMIALVLAGCGGGSSTTSMSPKETCEAADGRYEADGTCTSAMDLAVEAEAKGIADAIAAAEAAADALTAESSIEDVAAAQALVTAARESVEGAEHATPAATLASNAEIDAIGDTVMMAKVAVDERIADEMAMAGRVAAQKEALMTAVAGIDTSDLSTAEAIAAARTAITALQAALDMAADVSDDDKAMYQSQLDDATEAVAMAQTGLDRDGRMMAQRTVITDAVTEARAAVAMVDDDATEAQVTAADAAVAALKAAIDGAEDLDEGDAAVVGAQATLTTLEGQLSSAKESRTAAMEAAEKERRMAEAEEERKRNEAMAATAAKLYADIYAPANDATGTEVGDVFAAYNADDTAIVVTTGDGTNANSATLAADDDAMVADNHGWEGTMYTRTTPAAEGVYEAVVYSNVADPTMGKKFGSVAPVTTTGAYEYQLTAGALAIDTTGTDTPTSRVGGSNFDHSAGVKTFALPDPNPNMETVVTVAGTFHGVAGTYSCTPGAATCAANVAGMGGFELGNRRCRQYVHRRWRNLDVHTQQRGSQGAGFGR